MSYKTYEEYKDSEVEWIGEIPEHWEKHRIKDYLSFKIGGTPSTSIEEYFEGDNVWISISDLNNNPSEIINNSSTKISDDAIKYSNVKKISKGSLLYSFKLSVGLTAFAGCDLYTNEAIASFEPNDYVDLNFLKYVFKVGFENNATENIYGATLFNSDLLNFSKFVMPTSLNEQKVISDYLDNNISKINLNISKNKELINLLEEKKISLINQCVTKGLNPDVPMKDSGIEWIGEIPSNWNIKKLKYVSKLNEKSLHENTNPNFKFYYLDISNFNKTKFQEENMIYFDESPSRARRICKEEDVIVSTVRTYLKAIKFLENIPKPLVVSTGFCVLSSFNEINSKFLFYLLSSELYVQRIMALSKGIAYPSITSFDMENIKIIYPNINIQNQIVEFLDIEIGKLNNKKAKIQQKIDLLEEYKTSLIHHVVTGKIDVREVKV